MGIHNWDSHVNPYAIWQVSCQPNVYPKRKIKALITVMYQIIQKVSIEIVIFMAVKTSLIQTDIRWIVFITYSIRLFARALETMFSIIIKLKQTNWCMCSESPSYWHVPSLHLMHTNKLTPGTYILTLIRDFFILDNTVAT